MRQRFKFRFTHEMLNMSPSAQFDAIFLWDGIVHREPVYAMGLVRERVFRTPIGDGTNWTELESRSSVDYDGLFYRPDREGFELASVDEAFVGFCPKEECPEEYLADTLDMMRRHQQSKTIEPVPTWLS